MYKVAVANLSDLYLIYFPSFFFSFIFIILYYHVQKYSISTDKSGEIIVTVQVRKLYKILYKRYFYNSERTKINFSAAGSLFFYILEWLACLLLDTETIKFMFQLQQHN